MTELSGRIERIAVVGRDTQVWITALAVQRALAPAGATVTVFEIPSMLLASDVIAAVPSIAELHKLLGIDDRRVVEACSGTPMVAQRFANWGRSRATFLHGYDPASGIERDFSFVHYWVKARRDGMTVDYEDFSPAAATAKQNRVPVSTFGFGEELAAPGFGYQLDASAYAATLKQLAIKRGIECREGRLGEVYVDGEQIEAIEWNDGERIEADLFIDATGPEAALIAALPGSQFESWKQWFGADRIVSASAPVLTTIPAFANIVAFRGGWIALHPLQDRTAITGAVSSQVADREMLENIPVIANVPHIIDEIVLTPCRTGIRRDAWIGNCVAVGAAAADLEALDSALIHFLHVGIGHLVGELSSGADALAMRDSYNRNLARVAEAIRDFQLAHYRLNSRYDEAYWDQARDASGPASLEARIETFRRDGTVRVADDEPFQETNWNAVMIGHGVIPEGQAAWAEQVPEDRHMALMQRRLHSIAEAVGVMPTVEQYLGHAQPALIA
ncbi:MAG: tryptophan 7-halogenase [Sphingomicrobium sp.]